MQQLAAKANFLTIVQGRLHVQININKKKRDRSDHQKRHFFDGGACFTCCQVVGVKLLLRISSMIIQSCAYLTEVSEHFAGKTIAVPAGGAGGAIAPQVSKIWAKLRFFGQ